MTNETETAGDQSIRVANIQKRLADPPALQVADVAAVLAMAAEGCTPVDNGMAAVPLEIVLEAHALLLEQDRKLHPERWTPAEVAAWGGANAPKAILFRNLRQAR